MSGHLIEDPLAVDCTFPDSSTYLVRLDHLPAIPLVRDLAQGLVQDIHPLGGLSTRISVQAQSVILRHMVRTFHLWGFAGGAADLTRPMLIRYWLSLRIDREKASRRLLRGVERAGIALDDDVREHLHGRSTRLPPPGTPLSPYSEAEWRSLMDACSSDVDAAWQAHREVMALAASAKDPNETRVSRAAIARLLAANGPILRVQAAKLLGLPRRQGLVLLDHLGFAELRIAMFPDNKVAQLFRLALGAHSGIVPEGLGNLGLGDIDWAGDTDVLLRYTKWRTAPESLHLPAKATRVLRRWLRMTQLLRTFAPATERDQLWLSSRAPSGHAGLALGSAKHWQTAAATAWAAQHDLVDDDGAPLRIDRRRIRTTYENLLSRRGWSGRTTIDPNHSARVEGDHYLSSHTPAQRDAINEIIEQAQGDILSKALPARILTEVNTAIVATRAAAALTGLSMNDPDAQALFAGDRDVFTAACVDSHAGLRGPKGQPCPARPWVCLLCPLAVFLPRHAVSLLRLKAFFARQFLAMGTGQFLAVFGPYSHRLNEQILPRYSPTVIADAARQIHDEPTTLLLRPEETA